MAKTRSRRGARRNITRRGGGKGSMHVEKPKKSLKKKSIKRGKLTIDKMRILTKKEIKGLNREALEDYVNWRLGEIPERYQPYVENSPSKKPMNNGENTPHASAPPSAPPSAPVAPFYPTINKEPFNVSSLKEALEGKANNNSLPPPVMNNK